MNYDVTSTDKETGDKIRIDMSISTSMIPYAIKALETLVCQAKETLRAREVKQKTWDQKVENPVVQPEQESSIHNNAQTSPEKEQSQKIVKTNKKQYIVTYPEGNTVQFGKEIPNSFVAKLLLSDLEQGHDITITHPWKVQVIDL